MFGRTTVWRICAICVVPVCQAIAGAQAPSQGAGPRFVELTCSQPWGSAANVPDSVMRCGTVTVPQNRKAPNDSRLISVVLPVVIYSGLRSNVSPLLGAATVLFIALATAVCAVVLRIGKFERFVFGR